LIVFGATLGPLDAALNLVFIRMLHHFLANFVIHLES